MVTSTLAWAVPEFVRYSQTSGSPEPTNHMSELGCEQLTTPMPEASACSASNPSAICPVADTELPPPLAPPGAVTVVAAAGTLTVTGAAGAALAVGVPFPDGEVLPGVGVPAAVGLPLAGVAAAGATGAAGPGGGGAKPAATPALAVPVDAPVPVPVDDDDDCEGTAIMDTCAVPSPGADGGHDRVTEVTAAACPAATVARLAAGWVDKANRATAASASSTPPRSAKRRIMTPRPYRGDRPSRATGSAARACSPGASGVPAFLLRRGRPQRWRRARQVRRRPSATVLTRLRARPDSRRHPGRRARRSDRAAPPGPPAPTRRCRDSSPLAYRPAGRRPAGGSRAAGPPRGGAAPASGAPGWGLPPPPPLPQSPTMSHGACSPKASSPWPCGSP